MSGEIQEGSLIRGPLKLGVLKEGAKEKARMDLQIMGAITDDFGQLPGTVMSSRRASG